MEVLAITISFCLLLSLIINLKLMKDKSSLQKENVQLHEKVNKIKGEKEELVSIDPGDKAIIPDYGLKHTDNNLAFHVTYEVEIVEVSLDKVKVVATDFTSNDSFARDPKNRSAIIGYMKNKWISKKDIELVVDEQMRRDKKLIELGI